MKSKILSIVLLILLVASLSLGYRIGYRNARKGVAFLAVDTKDTLQGPVKEESDPYLWLALWHPRAVTARTITIPWNNFIGSHC